MGSQPFDFFLAKPVGMRMHSSGREDGEATERMTP